MILYASTLALEESAASNLFPLRTGMPAAAWK